MKWFLRSLLVVLSSLLVSTPFAETYTVYSCTSDSDYRYFPSELNFNRYDKKIDFGGEWVFDHLKFGKDTVSGSKTIRNIIYTFKLFENGKLTFRAANDPGGSYDYIKGRTFWLYKCNLNSQVSINNNDQVEISEDGGATSSEKISNLEKSKKVCGDLGFADGSEKFGECVLKLLDIKSSKSAENSENNIWEHIIDDQNGDVFIDRKNNLIMTKANFSWYNKIHERLMKNPKLDIRFDFKFQQDRNYKPKKYMFDQDIKPKIEAKVVDGIRTFIIQSNRIDELINPQGKYVRFFATDYEDGLWFVTGALKINQ